MTQAISTSQPAYLVPEPPPRSAKEIREQVQLIQDVMKEVMQEGQHYGVIPGTERKDKDGKDISKKTLLKPGAEKLCLTFRLAPSYTIQENADGQHLSITSTCTLTSIPTGRVWGTGMGSCSTKEKKYAYSQAVRTCPACKKEAIIKGKEEFGGGWVCFKKKDGCGAKYQDGDPAIEGQAAGRVPNEYVADTYNTVLKIANKRSLVAAVLNVTAASDIFTQDINDPEEGVIDVEATPVPTPVAVPKANGATAVQPPQRKSDTAVPAANGHDPKTRLWQHCVTMAQGDENKARELLQNLTSFTNDKGERVAGKRDIAALSDKWAASTLKKIDKSADVDPHAEVFDADNG